jgi:hypothetical protein
VDSDPEKALDKIPEDTRALEEGLETEVTGDVEKAKGEEARFRSSGGAHNQRPHAEILRHDGARTT